MNCNRSIWKLHSAFAVIFHSSFHIASAQYTLDEPEDSEGTCLLANSFHSSDRVVVAIDHDAEPQPASLLMYNSKSRRMMSLLADADEHRSWRSENLKLWLAANESKGVLDDFIDNQEDASDFCSSRLKEAKRALDGLLHDLHDLTIEVQSHEEVLATETENLNITYLSIEAVNERYNEHVKKCKKEREDAVKELMQYRAELEELEQIANPEVRYNDAQKKIPTVLLEEGVWTLERCEQFVEFSARHRPSFLQMSEDVDIRANSNVSSLQRGARCSSVFSEVEVKVGSISRVIKPKKDIEDTGHGSYPCGGINQDYHGLVWLNCVNGHLIADARRCFKPEEDKALPSTTAVPTTTEEATTTAKPIIEEEEVLEPEPTAAPTSAPVPVTTPKPISPSEKISCDTQREELQKAFTKAYLDVRDLVKTAEERSEDESCFETATSEKAAEMVPLVAQRDQAAGRIQHSSAALAAIEPVLNLLKDRVMKLRKHIKNTLVPECKESAEVSEYLEKVRELIMSLEECPGRNDFALQIPAGEESSSKVAPGGEDSLLQMRQRSGGGQGYSRGKTVLMRDHKDGIGNVD